MLMKKQQKNTVTYSLITGCALKTIGNKQKLYSLRHFRRDY